MAFNGGSAQGPGGEGQLPRVGGCRSQWRVLAASHPGAEWPHLLTSAQRRHSASETSALARPLCTAQPGPPPTHRPGHGTGQQPHRNLVAKQGSVWPGKARGGRAATWGCGGHSPYLGKYKMWSSVMLAPWTLCSNLLTTKSSTGSERAVGHRAPGAPAGRGGPGALGTGSVCPPPAQPCLTPAPLVPFLSHTWAYLQGCVPEPPMDWQEVSTPGGREGRSGGAVCPSGLVQLPGGAKCARSQGAREDAPYSFTDSRCARSRYRMAKLW